MTRVAPITGAWIETRKARRRIRRSPRRPHHGGVDRNLPELLPNLTLTSRPHHGGVDRNRIPVRRMIASKVAPITGAWIETLPSFDESAAKKVAPITGAWIETRRRRIATR